MKEQKKKKEPEMKSFEIHTLGKNTLMSLLNLIYQIIDMISNYRYDIKLSIWYQVIFVRRFFVVFIPSLRGLEAANWRCFLRKTVLEKPKIHIKIPVVETVFVKLLSQAYIYKKYSIAYLVILVLFVLFRKIC